MNCAWWVHEHLFPCHRHDELIHQTNRNIQLFTNGLFYLSRKLYFRFHVIFLDTLETWTNVPVSELRPTAHKAL